MAKSNSQSVATRKLKPKVSRPGIHAKTKYSNNKKSKLYKKLNRGQG